MAGSDGEALLITRRRSSLRGRYVFEAAPADLQVRPPSGQRPFVFVPVDDLTVPVTPAWTTRPDFTFEVSGLSGRYRVRPPTPAGWSVKELRLGGMDVTDTGLDFSGADIDGLEIVLTNAPAVLVGYVALPDHVVAAAVTVVVIAADRAKWGPGSRYVVAVTPDATGRFAMRFLPPGEYLAVAFEGLEAGEEGNHELLERIRQDGESLRIVEGESVTVNLRLVVPGVNN